jgi:hypothetical protein
MRLYFAWPEVAVITLLIARRAAEIRLSFAVPYDAGSSHSAHWQRTLLVFDRHAIDPDVSSTNRIRGVVKPWLVPTTM